MTEVNEKLIIKMYLDGISGHKIAASIGLKPHQVYYILKKNNIESRDNSINSKRFQFNENFFEIIDSEPKAYWLGFLFADGYVLTNSNSFGLSLSTKDISHMEKFLKDISSNHKINVCGTREFLTGVLNAIGYNSRLYQRHPERNVNNYDIDIGGNRQVINILSFIYRDATVYLERKYNRFLELKSLCQEIDNRKLCENGETL